MVHASSIMFVKIYFLALALSYNFVVGIVDESSPDLSKYNLRRVNTEIYANNRANEDTLTFRDATEKLHDALSSNSYYVKCSAYAHLFRMLNEKSSIRQDAIDALALVSSEDRVFYKQLLKRDNPLASTENIANAIFDLGKDSTYKGMHIMMELVKCAHLYMDGDDKNVMESKIVELLSQRGFNKHFDFDQSVANKGFVEENESLPVCNEVCKEILEQARKLIAQYDNKKVSEARARAEKSPVLHIADEMDDEDLQNQQILLNRAVQTLPSQDESKPDSRQESRNEKSNEPEETDDKEVEIENSEEEENQGGQDNQEDLVNNGPRDQENQEEPKVNVEVLVPEETPSAPVVSDFTESQLLVLRLVRMRISSFREKSNGNGKSSRMPISSIMDFDGNWKLLRKAKLNSNTKLGADAIAFRNDLTSIEIARRVENIVGAYAKVAKMFGRILDVQKKRKSQDLSVAFWNLEQLLKELDPVVDVADIQRAIDNYKNKDRKKKFNLIFWKH